MVGQPRKQRSPAGRSKMPGALAADLRVAGGVSKLASSLAKQRQAAVVAAGAGCGAKGKGKLQIVYCPIYCRTGKCERRGKGCPFR